MATAPAHVSTASALTKQKLLQNIQMKEQQKIIEQALSQHGLSQLGGQELLAQALKSIMPQVHICAHSSCHYITKEDRRVVAVQRACNFY